MERGNSKRRLTLKLYMTAPAEDESMKVHLAAEEAIAEEKAKSGTLLSYLEGVRRVELARRKPQEDHGSGLCSCGLPPHRVALVAPELEAADPGSVKLHLAAKAELEQAKRQGSTISYFEAVKRASAKIAR